MKHTREKGAIDGGTLDGVTLDGDRIFRLLGNEVQIVVFANDR